MKKISMLILILLLAACSPGGETSDTEEVGPINVLNDSVSTGTSTGVEEQSGDVNTASIDSRLNADYDDALPVDVQLAIGTMQLEGTDLAVDTELAEKLLPLWRALQSLTTSDTAAPVEITAVLNQIQATMSPEQVQAIADMALTQDAVNAMIEAGTLTLGFGRGGAGGGSGEDGGQGGGFGGGGVPGGRPGGGPGGGGLPGGQIDPSAIETRQAELAESGDDPFAALMRRGMSNAIIRLLETKTGEVTTRDNPFTIALGVVSVETGLTVAEIQEQTAVGKSLVDIIVENGGEVTTVQDAIIASLSETPFGQNQEDLAQVVHDMLQNTFDPASAE